MPHIIDVYLDLRTFRLVIVLGELKTVKPLPLEAIEYHA